MSRSEQELHDRDEKWSTARAIANAANVLAEWKYHENYFFTGKNEIVSAYKYGEKLFTDREVDGIFDTRQEMKEIIGEVAADNQAIECYVCAKDRND